ncbi:MAG: hypothetical protein HC859_11330 [Bacteroidia bacterium]|nr:hypothetical protein [Bacteroidia bacterium]
MSLLVRPTVGLKNKLYDNRSTFYNIYFQVMESKFGIVLGGEVRGNFPSDEPYINVYLAKAFSLSKLADLFAGK